MESLSSLARMLTSVIPPAGLMRRNVEGTRVRNTELWYSSGWMNTPSLSNACHYHARRSRYADLAPRPVRQWRKSPGLFHLKYSIHLRGIISHSTALAIRRRLTSSLGPLTTAHTSAATSSAARLLDSAFDWTNDQWWCNEVGNRGLQWRWLLQTLWCR